MISKKLKLIVVSTALALGAVGGFAAAKGGGGHHDPAKKAEMLKKFDANGDGKLDDAERAKMKEAFAAKRAARTAQFDADKDGTLSDTERAAMKEQRTIEKFKKLDTNGDGKLSLDEFKAGQQHMGRGGHRRGGGMHK